MGLLKMNKFELICLIVVWLRKKGNQQQQTNELYVRTKSNEIRNKIS